MTGLGATGGTVWVGTANGWVISFDPRTGALSRGVRLGTRVASLSAARSELWVTVNVPVPAAATYPGLDTLRLDPRTGKLAQDTGLPMASVSTDGTTVWGLGSAPPYGSDAGLLAKIGPTTGTMSEKAQLSVTGYNVPDTLGVSAGTAWVINDGAGKQSGGGRPWRGRTATSLEHSGSTEGESAVVPCHDTREPPP